MTVNNNLIEQICLNIGKCIQDISTIYQNKINISQNFNNNNMDDLNKLTSLIDQEIHIINQLTENINRFNKNDKVLFQKLQEKFPDKKNQILAIKSAIEIFEMYYPELINIILNEKDYLKTESFENFINEVAKEDKIYNDLSKKLNFMSDIFQNKNKFNLNISVLPLKKIAETFLLILSLLTLTNKT